MRKTKKKGEQLNKCNAGVHDRHFTMRKTKIKKRGSSLPWCQKFRLSMDAVPERQVLSQQIHYVLTTS